MPDEFGTDVIGEYYYDKLFTKPEPSQQQDQQAPEGGENPFA